MYYLQYSICLLYRISCKQFFFFGAWCGATESNLIHANTIKIGKKSHQHPHCIHNNIHISVCYRHTSFYHICCFKHNIFSCTSLQDKKNSTTNFFVSKKYLIWLFFLQFDWIFGKYPMTKRIVCLNSILFYSIHRITFQLNGT